TWAAYQCYGDPDWKLSGRGGWESTKRKARADEFDHIASTTSLSLAQQTLIVQSTFQGYDPAYQLERVRMLEQRWQKMQWAVSSAVADQFAQAYRAAGDLAGAIRWYETAVEQSGGQVSFRTLEEISNIRIRHAFEVVSSLKAEAGRLASAPHDGGARAARQQRGDLAKRLRAALASARTTIKDELSNLDKLIAVQATGDGESLRGP